MYRCQSQLVHDALSRAREDLLPLEDVLVELLLQALIGQVDTQLLKAVLLETLKAIYIQNSNRVLATLAPWACNKKANLS